MYFLLKMVIFHCYVSLPEGNTKTHHMVGAIMGPSPPKTCALRSQVKKKENKKVPKSLTSLNSPIFQMKKTSEKNLAAFRGEFLKRFFFDFWALQG